MGPARNKIPIAETAEIKPIDRATNNRLLEMNSATIATVIPIINQGVVGMIAKAAIIKGPQATKQVQPVRNPNDKLVSLVFMQFNTAPSCRREN